MKKKSWLHVCFCCCCCRWFCFWFFVFLLFCLFVLFLAFPFLAFASSPFPGRGPFVALTTLLSSSFPFFFFFFYERAKTQCSRRRICLAVLEEYCNERSSINQNSYVPQQYLLAQHQYSRHARYYKMLLPRRSLNERALRTRIKDRELF